VFLVLQGMGEDLGFILSSYFQGSCGEFAFFSFFIFSVLNELLANLAGGCIFTEYLFYVNR
jgi:hypothetical protein